MVNATTFDFYCDFGRARTCRHRIRLAGITVARTEAEAAKAWVEAWISAHTAVAPPALLLSLPAPCRHRRLQHGRLMAPDGALLNRDLVQSGHGQLQ